MWFTGDWQEKLELWWELIFSVKSVREVDSPDSAVSVDLHSQGLYVVCTIRSPREIGQVELDLVPTFIQPHRHRANEWLHTSRRLIIGSTESSPYALIIEYLHLECEVFLQVLDDHDQERKLDSKSLLWIKRSVDIVCGNIGSHDLKDGRLNIRISDSFDVTVPDTFVPNLQWL